MSKIKNGGLDQYGAEPFEQQQFETGGVERVNVEYNLVYQDQHLTGSQVVISWLRTNHIYEPLMTANNEVSMPPTSSLTATLPFFPNITELSISVSGGSRKSPLGSIGVVAVKGLWEKPQKP